MLVNVFPALKDEAPDEQALQQTAWCKANSTPPAAPSEPLTEARAPRRGGQARGAGHQPFRLTVRFL
jgi:hypothetical protein